MPDYRLYCLDGTSHISNGEWFDAESDAEAIAFVQAKKLHINCEIWREARLVARLPACLEASL